MSKWQFFSKTTLNFLLFVALKGVPISAWAAPRVLLDRLETYVNSSIILASDVKKFRETVKLRSQLDPLFSGTPLAAQGAQASTQEIVEFLTNEALISQQFPKSDTDVEQEINSIQNNNHLDRATLKAALAQQGFKFSDYFELIRGSGSKRDLIDRDIRTKVNIGEADIEAELKKQFLSTSAPRAYHIEMITISTKNYKKATDAFNIAFQARKDILEGEPFPEVAKRVSDDSLATSGGDLGTLTEDQISPTIRDQVKKLKPGEISEVLGNAQSGRFFFLKLMEVKFDDNDRLQKMRDEIRARLASVEYQHQVALWIEKQRQSAFIHPLGEKKD